MTGRGWRTYTITIFVFIAVYQAIPDTLWRNTAFKIGIGFSAAGAMLLGARRLPREDRLPWWLFAAGIIGNCSGAPVMNFSGLYFDDWTSPSFADAAYLTYYPFCAAGLILLIRNQRSRSRIAALVDAATITAGLGLLVWIYAIEPALADAETSPFARLVRVSYPVGDLVLIALTVLLIRNGVPRQSTPRWIAVAQVIFLAGDLIWLVIGTLSPDLGADLHVNRGIDMVYLTAFALFGGANRRAADTAQAETPGRQARSTAPLMLMLGSTLLIAPVLLVMELAGGGVRHGLSIAVGCALMSMLVVTRMSQLLRHSERQALVVHELSRRDELTGLPNRRAWIDELPRVLEQARLRGEPVSVAMIDLDRFKLYNDRYGHPAGDRLLKEASAAWFNALRRSDILARYGGEEFIALLPGADLTQAIQALERARAVTPGDQTFSAGVATWHPGESADDLIIRADAALYRAKETGRDRIVPGSDPGPAPAAQVLGA
ncbi:MAG: GGDEF domain-containing protein [Actinoplanes sp.]